MTYNITKVRLEKKGWNKVGTKESIFLGCTWHHHFLKSKTKEPPNLLTSSGMRGGKFISVNNF